jgi:hypothetical protein
MPAWLSAESFASYPAQGKELAVARLADLRQIPVALLPIFLVDLKVYDWKFPVEQAEIQKRIEFAGTNPSSLAAFRNIAVSPALDNPAKVANPQQFLAEMTAYLWSSLQMDAYRSAANQFVAQFAAASEPVRPVAPRLVMICVGQGADAPAYPLFNKLRSLGQMRTNIQVEGAADSFLHALHQRAESHPEPYAHWYVDGGNPWFRPDPENVARISFPALAPLNAQILARMRSCIETGTGPEVLHRELAELSERPPSGSQVSTDPRIQHFALSLLTDGSGTQIFSTSFVQWTTREVLRRAQPLTLLTRYAPRQRQKSFNAMVESAASSTDLDANGSLIDADMGAYYAFLEMNNLFNPDGSAFLVWFENHTQALVAGPKVPAGTTKDSPTTIAQLLSEIVEHG